MESNIITRTINNILNLNNYTQMSEQTKELILSQVTELEPETQQNIIAKFLPFYDQLEDWKGKAESLVVTDSLQRKEIKEAKEARLALKRVRISANKIREMLKRDSLAYGRAVQAVYNAIEEKIKPLEDHLLKQENFVEIQREKMINALRTERVNSFILDDLIEFVPVGVDLGALPVEDYEKMQKYCENQKSLKREAALADEIEKRRREELAEYREYADDVVKDPVDIRTMPEKDYKALLKALEKAKKDAEEAAQAEEKRLKAENEKLKAEAEERKAREKAEQDKRDAEARKLKDRYDKRIEKLKAIEFTYYPALPLETDMLYNFTEDQFIAYQETARKQVEESKKPKEEEAVLIPPPPKAKKGVSKASGGTWKIGNGNFVVTDDPAGFGGSHTEESLKYYGGYLIAESILKKPDAHLISAAPIMLEALKNIENDDGSIPKKIWDMRNAAIAKAEGK
jgi:hypothetical protein